jgi:hypothetical protein
VVAIGSVEFESLGAAAVADDLRKLHLLFSLGVAGGIEIGVTGFSIIGVEFC